ncbi:MAG: iron donor protein CyaY [Gammaproteobacteria bacterium]|nr:iron donor protein CyaY [Gammaproteobacteria bacterium]
MNESEFNQLAEQTLIAIEEAIEASGAEIDYDTISDILTLEFENGSQIIINKQTPATQIWVAAKSGGFHFDYDSASQSWRLDSDASQELFDSLSRYCSEQAGETVELIA